MKISHFNPNQSAPSIYIMIELCYFSLDQWEIRIHLLWGKSFNIPLHCDPHLNQTKWLIFNDLLPLTIPGVLRTFAYKWHVLKVDHHHFHQNLLWQEQWWQKLVLEVILQTLVKQSIDTNPSLRSNSLHVCHDFSPKLMFKALELWCLNSSWTQTQVSSWSNKKWRLFPAFPLSFCQIDFHN